MIMIIIMMQNVWRGKCDREFKKDYKIQLLFGFGRDPMKWRRK